MFRIRLSFHFHAHSYRNSLRTIDKNHTVCRKRIKNKVTLLAAKEEILIFIMASEVRQNYHSDCEAGVNKLIRLEMDSLYLSRSLRSYFYNSQVVLPGIAEYFKRAVEEEMGHMQLFIDYQNKRGGKVKFEEIKKPEKQEWASGKTRKCYS